ncbi:hypothetical protein T440DRAFT_554322 [Plenodomus tracheiphilus IPT5]|uniref:Uncharacterized protein n=1 Tax=Plenodomus tracheiphilus IPT5 TaxID=1408161 RepID=A0A6A7B7E2_9PLEO|nr:hypothetical protein T440DRAFT_554322 [Plenodomus tracheiphilus IPT5]
MSACHGGEMLEVEMRLILELQRQIDSLEEQIQRLGNSVPPKAGARTSTSSQHAPSTAPSYQAEESSSGPTPHLRGGSAQLSSPSRPSPDFSHSSTHPLSSCPHQPPSHCTERLLHQATALQLHNAYLERELEEYKDMYESLTGDVKWLMGTQVELEELCEGLEEERDALIKELDGFKGRLRGGAASSDNMIRSSSEVGEVKTTKTDSTTKSPLPTTPNIPNNPPRPTLPIRLTAFTYHPSHSLITFPTATPPQTFHFPSAPTLPLIHAALHYRHNYIGEDNPYLIRAREILDIRQEMGIGLPDVFEEEVVVGVPGVLVGDGGFGVWSGFGGGVDRGVGIEARESVEGEGREMGEIVGRVGIGKEGNDDDDDYDEGRSIKGSWDKELVGDLMSEGGMCISDMCTGEEKAERGRMQILGVSIRGGGVATPLLGSENGSGPKHGNSGSRREEDSLTRSFRDMEVPPSSPESSKTTAFSERSATKVLKPETFTQVKELEDPCFTVPICDEDFWRHPKGSGCEQWATNLDRHRTQCTFCHLPFSGENSLARSSSAESVTHDDDAPILTSMPVFPRSSTSYGAFNTTDGANDTRPPPEDTIPHLRGGAGSPQTSESNYSDHDEVTILVEDWRTEWNTLADQTHQSGHHQQTFRNSSTLSTKEVEKPPTPITRHKSQPRLDGPSMFDERGNKRYNAWYTSYGDLRLGTEDAGQEIEEDVYDSKIPLMLHLGDPRPEGDVGVPLKRLETAGRQIWSNAITEGSSDRTQGPWNWFEDPRPAPPIPMSCRGVKTRAGIRSRLSIRFAYPIGLNKKFADARMSRGVTTASANPKVQSYTPGRFQRSSRRSTQHPRGILQQRIKKLLRRRRDCICEFLELTKPRPNVNVGATRRNKATSSTPGDAMTTAQTNSQAETQADVPAAEVEMVFSILKDLKKATLASSHTIKDHTSEPHVPLLPDKSVITKFSLNKPLPPIPEASTATLPYILRGGPKDPIPWTHSAVESEPEEDLILKRAESLVTAENLEISNLMSINPDSWVPPTIAGPADAVRDVIRVLKWREKRETETMTDLWEAMEYEEKWRMVWATSQDLGCFGGARRALIHSRYPDIRQLLACNLDSA